MRILVAGIGTDVGKTVASAVLMTLLKADYWKPLECGDQETSDSKMIKQLTESKKHTIYPPKYSFKDPLSPHHAARLAGSVINDKNILPPNTPNPLIIESVGGIFVPISPSLLTIDLFEKWNANWIVVSRNYLGSINHTLLTLEALKKRKIPVIGLIFNGPKNPDTESVILNFSKLPVIGRLFEEDTLTIETTKKYASLWKKTELPR